MSTDAYIDEKIGPSSNRAHAVAVALYCETPYSWQVCQDIGHAIDACPARKDMWSHLARITTHAVVRTVMSLLPRIDCDLRAKPEQLSLPLPLPLPSSTVKAAVRRGERQCHARTREGNRCLNDRLLTPLGALFCYRHDNAAKRKFGVYRDTAPGSRFAGDKS